MLKILSYPDRYSVAPGEKIAFKISLEEGTHFDARLVRSMVYAPGFRPTLDEAAGLLATVMPEFEAAGVTLALETYEQVTTSDLVALVERVGSDRLGICLDPANVVAGLELPKDAVERCAPLTRSIRG